MRMGDAPTSAPTPTEIHKIDQEYRRDIAITTARPRIVQLGLLAWLLFDVALLVFFFYSVLLYLVSGSFSDQRLLGTLDNNIASLHESAAARVADPLLVGDARVLTRETGSYDVYAVLENPNAEWYATFTYAFSDSVSAAPVASAIMPGEEKYLLALNVASATKPSGVTVTVDDVVWHRVDRHAVANTAEFLVEHANFTVSESTYDDSLAFDSTKVGVSTFTITNNTPYGYYSPSFVVLLKNNGAVVAINQISVAQFTAGSTREVSVRWFGDVPGTGSVEVIPAINYFDESEYADPEGEVGSDIRDTTDRRR